MPITRHGYATTPRRNGSTRQWRTQRALVLDGARACAYCGKPPTTNNPLEAGHIQPHAYGGAPLAFNLQAVHRTCNRQRGAL